MAKKGKQLERNGYPPSKHEQGQLLTRIATVGRFCETWRTLRPCRSRRSPAPTAVMRRSETICAAVAGLESYVRYTQHLATTSGALGPHVVTSGWVWYYIRWDTDHA